VDVLRQLKEKWGYERVMVEGGAGVLTSFLEGAAAAAGGRGGGGEGGGLVDVCVVTIAPSFLGDGYRLIQAKKSEGSKDESKNKIRNKNETGSRGKGKRSPWLVRLGEEGGEGGGEGGTGWQVHRLGGDVVVIGRPQWPKEEGGKEGGKMVGGRGRLRG